MIVSPMRKKNSEFMCAAMNGKWDRMSSQYRTSLNCQWIKSEWYSHRPSVTRHTRWFSQIDVGYSNMICGNFSRTLFEFISIEQQSSNCSHFLAQLESEKGWVLSKLFLPFASNDEISFYSLCIPYSIQRTLQVQTEVGIYVIVCRDRESIA